MFRPRTRGSKAENSVLLLKKLRLLQSIREQNPQKQYEAVVTRVKNFGVTFEIVDLMLESFLHVSQLADDYYIYDEGRALLYGRRTNGSFCSGDRILVMLKDIDFITLETEWSYVASLKDEKREEKKSQKTPKEKNRSRNKPSRSRSLPIPPKKVLAKKKSTHKKSPSKRKK